VDALEQPAEYTWSVARKSVNGREAIQLERLVGELTWWHASRYVHVPRDGAESRFVPVKDGDDLDAAQEQIAAICRARLAIDV
jgi:UTP--glucose-1-phosphate uridylyltransferase